MRTANGEGPTDERRGVCVLHMGPMVMSIRSRTFAAIVLAIGLISLPRVACGVESDAGHDDESAAKRKAIAALIAQLDDDVFDRREAASAKLTAMGDEAMPQVAAAMKHPSAEVRWRAERIVKTIHERALDAAFQRLAATTDDAKIDLEEGMWLIARIDDPLVDRKKLRAQLDALAAKVRRRLGDGDPAKADPEKVIAAMRAVIFEDEGLTGDTETYSHPDNSLLHRVLERKKGLPILLSHVVVAVADRLGAPVVGLGMPLRYMVKYDGSRAPAGFARKDIVLDPFGGGQVVDDDAIRELVGSSYDPEMHLQPYPHRATIARMLSNLHNHYERGGHADKAARTARYQMLMQLSPQE